LAAERAQGAFKILALDYGRTKIGLALADSAARIAQPFDTMERINRNEDMRRLRELARDLGVRQIVVGLPLRLDGTGGEMADEATGFARRVHKQIGVPVELVDERLSSWEAERILEEEMGRRIVHEETPHGRKKTKGAADGKYTVDAVAAMVILREYLARTPLPEGSPHPAGSACRRRRRRVHLVFHRKTVRHDFRGWTVRRHSARSFSAIRGAHFGKSGCDPQFICV
jgi:putative pre-16S rRNA nuclease